MLWLVKDDSSHEIVGCNIFVKDGLAQLWVTRTNGKSLMIQEDSDRAVVSEVKEAIDFAIEHNEKALRLS